MSKRVQVRRLNDVEGRELQQIVRRGGKSDRSIVKWRRAMVVLASAGGNDVAAIARLVQTSPDRVREIIHRFNDLGMRSRLRLRSCHLHRGSLVGIPKRSSPSG